MSVQKDIHLSVNYPAVSSQPEVEGLSPLDGCQIDIQVANGWAVTGYYRDNILQAVSLRKHMVVSEAK